MIIPGRGALVALLLLPFTLSCAGELPPPQTRPIIVFTGERIQADAQRMVEVEQWMRPQLEDVELNPGFLIRLLREDVARYPWSTLDIVGDTADIRIQASAPDAETPYLIYAHFRLMQESGDLDQWLPVEEGEGGLEELSALEIERRILARVSDVWLLGRSVFDTHPYGPLDELLWANEAGYLEDFILATQAERFSGVAPTHAARTPARLGEFQSWFQRTFERDEPGFIGVPAPEETAGDDADPV